MNSLAPIRRWLSAALLAPMCLMLPSIRAAAPTEVVRIGVSLASFGRVSRSDATAAMKAWATAVTRDLGFSTRFQVEVFESEAELATGLARNEIEAATMTLEGFHSCGFQPEEVFIAARNEGFERQFALLTRRDSTHLNLANLRDQELVLHTGTGSGIAVPWLETTLHEQNLGRAETFFRRVNRLESASKCVLRVFFGQSAACLVSTPAYEVACELNPQLRTALQRIATSPPLVPALFFFRPNYTAPSRAKAELALEQLHASPAGQQLLTVFMATSMQRQPASCLSGTRQLLDRFLQLQPTSPNRPTALSQEASSPPPER